MEYLLNGPDDGAGDLSFGRTATPPAPRRPFNRTHQLPALIEAAEKLEEDGRLPHEVLKLEPGTSMGRARPKVTVEDDAKSGWPSCPRKPTGTTCSASSTRRWSWPAPPGFAFAERA